MKHFCNIFKHFSFFSFSFFYKAVELFKTVFLMYYMTLIIYSAYQNKRDFYAALIKASDYKWANIHVFNQDNL